MFGDETERHLHNYVAAAQSRVDLLRRFIRKDMPEGLREYQQRIDDEFKGAPLHKFIIDLRNLMLHVRLPVSTTRETWERGGPYVFRVMLDSADLLERWRGWSDEARQYIEASGESVDLRRTVVLRRAGDHIRSLVAEGISTQHLEDIESFQRAAKSSRRGWTTWTSTTTLTRSRRTKRVTACRCRVASSHGQRHPQGGHGGHRLDLARTRSHRRWRDHRRYVPRGLDAGTQPGPHARAAAAGAGSRSDWRRASTPS